MKDAKIFFATDIHGSDRCLRKFLNAGKFYGVDAVVMGGDITGKMIVPVVEEGPGRYSAHLFGRRREVDSDGLAGLHKFIADAGFYPHPMTPDEMAALREDPAAVEELFRKLMNETMSRWIDLAEDRLAGTGIECIFAPGNDDPFFIDDLLSSSDSVVNPDGRVVELPGGYSMISVGYSNRTPWASPRELDEADLRAAIDAEVAKLPDPRGRSSTCTSRRRTPRSTRPWSSTPTSGRWSRAAPRHHRRRQLGRAGRHRGVPADAEPARSHPRVPR